jgi:hypothetical protein
MTDQAQFAIETARKLIAQCDRIGCLWCSSDGPPETHVNICPQHALRTLLHDFDRGVDARKEYEALYRLAREIADKGDQLPEWKKSEFSATFGSASDAVGWMDSEGPVTVAPGRPKAAKPRRHDGDGEVVE